MSLSYARGAPVSVQVFSWVFLIRPPLQDEVPEIQSLLATLRRRWGRLAVSYLVFITVLVVPGVLRDRDPTYTAAAIVLPHLLLYVVVSASLNIWAGFRINLGNMGKVWTANARRRKESIATVGILFSVGLVVGPFSGAFGDRFRSAVHQWLDDTLTRTVIGFLLVVLLLGLPELLARLRLQQHTMSLQLAEAQTAQERLARVTAESELRLLQAQVEPHFLYNTLANLRFLVQTGSADALRMTDALIDYLRTSVPDMRAQQVTLGREIEHARHYLDIMQMRMGGRLDYAIQVPVELRDVALPPLVLLTLVENAVKHGIAPLVEGGRITLSVRADGDMVIVSVADDGVGLQAGAATPAPAGNGGTGLSNIRARLALVYGGSAELQVTAAEPRGPRALRRGPRLAPQANTAHVAVEVLMLNEEKDTAAGPAADAALPST
ncbi:MAG: sensor histidine kinase, partial [Betaproteobacteria bacterium]